MKFKLAYESIQPFQNGEFLNNSRFPDVTLSFLSTTDKVIGIFMLI